METEYALGFTPTRPGESRPSHRELFDVLRTALLRERTSCAALYYKDAEFLSDGSLLHFEPSQVEDLDVGLLEWATPECLGPAEAVAVLRAQEQALRAAIPEAEALLAERGFAGRVIVLKNNVDRRGNAYGSHESSDAWERPRGVRAWLFLAVLHPLALVLLGAVVLPLVALLIACVVVYGVAAGLAAVPGLSLVGRPLERGLAAVGTYLVEVRSAPGSGAVARATAVLVRLLAVAFSWTGREVVLPGHVPALVPFLVTRPAIAGAGRLRPDGRYVLSHRASITTQVAAAFVFGRTRPLIDLKEFLVSRPFGFGRRRKRLQLSCGDATRADVATRVRLGATCLVLDAIEAGALDAVAGRLELRDGPLGAFRHTCEDPTLQAPVARDRGTGELLSALDVQRRYLEAVWAHARRSPALDPELADVLQRWDQLLAGLREDPASQVGAIDWVTKLELMREALVAAFPGTAPAAAWARLVAWGPANAALERSAPGLDLPDGLDAAAVRERLRGGLGRRGFARVRRRVERAGLEWGELPAVRVAWLKLAVIDLSYHELSAAGGAFDVLRDRGEVVEATAPDAIERAARGAPERTRARLRALAVEAAGRDGPRVRVGWERVQIGEGEAALEFRLEDPYRTAFPELEAALRARAGVGAREGTPLDPPDSATPAPRPPEALPEPPPPG